MLQKLLKAPTGQNAREIDSWFTPGRFALLMALFILVMFPDVVLGGRTFIFRDFGLFGYPLAFHHRQSFWNGEIPLWNPLSHSGLPFLAQWNTMVLYPGSLFYVLLPLDWALGIFNLLHLFLCGLSMYALSWKWSGSRLAATIAGLGFAFNGFTLNCLIWPNYMASLAWMPLVVLATERAWEQGGRAIILAVLAGTMQMFSGTPEVILLTWLLTGCLWLGHLLRTDAARLKVVLRIVAVVLLITGLAAAQLLPFLDLLRCSERETSSPIEEWSMPVMGWVNFLVPLFHTHRSSPGVHFQMNQGITSSYYLGIGLTALALTAPWVLRKPRVRLLAVLTGISLVLALGPGGKLYPVLLKVFPVLALMRYPIKFVMLPVITVPLLAAFVVRDWVEADAKARKRLARIGSIVGAAFLLAIGLIVCFDRFHLAKNEVFEDTLWSGITRAGFLAGILVVGLLLARDGTARKLWGLALCLVTLVWLDAVTHAPRQNPTAERAVFQPHLPMLDSLEPRPAIGRSRAMLSLQALTEYQTRILTNVGYGYLLHRLSLYDNANLLDSLPKVDGFYALNLREEANLRYRLYPTPESYRVPLADFLSVSQVTCPTNLFAWTSRSTYMPMATAGQKPLFLDTTRRLDTLTSDDFDPRSTVLLEPKDQAWVSVTNRTSAKILSSLWSPHRISLDVQADEASLVVLSQSFYHNWRAYVDGHPTPVLRANHAFQAVQVPAGRHELKLVYEDWMFRVGVAISVASAAVCLLIWRRAGKLAPSSQPSTDAGVQANQATTAEPSRPA